jgi:hypothetical protein
VNVPLATATSKVPNCALKDPLCCFEQRERSSRNCYFEGTELCFEGSPLLFPTAQTFVSQLLPPRHQNELLKGQTVL